MPNIVFYKCDLSDFDAVQLATAEIKSTHGNPSVLINNAGIGKPLAQDPVCGYPINKVIH